MIPIILDTDIDTDVDNALALTLAVRSPEIDILAVTTVGVDIRLRGRIARKLLRVLGRAEIPVAAGCDRRLNGQEFRQCRLAPEDSLKTNRMDFPSKNSMLWISSSTSSRQPIPKSPWC